MRTDRNIDFVTGLRALAAMFVMMSHVWYQIWPAVPPPYGYGRRPEGLTATLTEWFYYGHFGVVVFLVLSGFCLMLPVVEHGIALRGSTLAFFHRRARRILPPYYAALALTLVVMYAWISDKTGSQWDISIPVTARGVVAHLVMAQDFIDSTQINYVYWSIAVEVQLYLLFPALVWAFRRFGPFQATAALCLAVYTLIGVLELVEYRDIPPQFIGLCAGFILGMMSATLLPREGQPDRRVPWGAAFAVPAVLVVVCCAVWGVDVAEQRLAVLDALCALATVALLLAAATPGRRNLARTILEMPALVKVGTFSYSLYLVHAPLLQLIWRFIIVPLSVTPALQWIILFALAVPSSLVVAYTFFVVFERPFLNAREGSGASGGPASHLLQVVSR